jgi:hypothetical protein
MAQVKKLLLPAIIILLLFCPAAAGAAQSITVSDIDLGMVGETEFVAGYAAVPAHAIFWASDVPWRITVSSRDPNLGVSDDGSYIKALDDLVWKLSDESAWTPMTQDAREVDWSDGTGEDAIHVDFVVILDWLKDVPGRYGTKLVFTIGGR